MFSLVWKDRDHLTGYQPMHSTWPSWDLQLPSSTSGLQMIYIDCLLFRAPFHTSDATVWFGPVQRTLCLNPEPDLWFSSRRLLNLGLDFEGPVQQVQFGESVGSNLEPQIFCINVAEKWCKLSSKFIKVWHVVMNSLHTIYEFQRPLGNTISHCWALGAPGSQKGKKTENKICNSNRGHSYRFKGI